MLCAPCNNRADVADLLVQGVFATAYRLHLQQMRVMHSLLAAQAADAKGLLSRLEKEEHQGDNVMDRATSGHQAAHANAANGSSSDV